MQVPMNIQELFSRQAGFVKLGEFETELTTMRTLQSLPTDVQEIRRNLYLEWIDSLGKPIQGKQSAENSTRLREEGNAIFTAKPRTSENILLACQCYTQAIFTAPPPESTVVGKSETLALAYANRAMALQEYGYFKQAYDDCECALQYGYPEQMLHKIITRQAYCALNLEDVERLQSHLAALESMALNVSFKQELNKLRAGFERLKKQAKKETPQATSDADFGIEAQRETQQIIESGDERGRYMIAAKPIKAGELIFTEHSPAFVPVGDAMICQQCATVLLVPYPCAFCNVQVIYCSLKCRIRHANCHAHECLANQRDLFSYIGIAHLAFRMVSSGLPQVVPLLAQEKNAADIWQALSNVNEGVFKHCAPVEYTQSLRMISHLGSMSNDDILWFALVAELLVIYLQELTVFFDVLKDVAAPHSDWELITAALILRHIGQLIANAHTSVSLVPQRAGQTYDPLYVPLFDTTIWSRPFHVKRGWLHKFSDYEEITAINFPYLSICNHSCQPSFQPRFSGYCVSTFATRDIAAGEEISNSYTLDYRKSKRSSRQKALMEIYKFECSCAMCTREDPDADYHQFHRYRCENPECKEIFVPELPELRTLNWWDSMDGLPPKEYIKCTKCGAPQYCKWFMEFNELLKTDAVATERQALFKAFDELSAWLLDYHEIKLFAAFQLVSDCFAAHHAGSPLTKNEFAKLIEIMKFYLAGIAAQTQTSSIEYVVKLTYLWDLMALGKFRCTKAEWLDMLKSTEILSQEFKVIFLNYYEDYLKPMVKT